MKRNPTPNYLKHKQSGRGRAVWNRTAMDKGAATFWPARKPIAVLMAKRAEISPNAFDTEYQGRLQSPVGAEWPPEYFDRPGLWFDEWPEGMTGRGQSLDPSKGIDSGSGDAGDYQAHILVGLSQDGNLYVEAVLVREPETKYISNIHYFGDPVYSYSLKEGIEDGFLAPYKVVKVTLDVDANDFRPEKGQKDKYGQEIEDCVFNQKDFDRSLVIDERTKRVAARITEFLKETGAASSPRWTS